MSLLGRKKKVHKRLASPGDYEAALIRLCKGDRSRAEALLLAELERSPALSRQGAALRLVTRMRHEQSPVSRL